MFEERFCMFEERLCMFEERLCMFEERFCGVFSDFCCRFDHYFSSGNLRFLKNNRIRRINLVDSTTDICIY